MQTINSIPASAASMIASAQNGAGTKIPLAVAPVAFTASFTVSNTGNPRCRAPPFPGVTPATILCVLDRLLRVEARLVAGESLEKGFASVH